MSPSAAPFGRVLVTRPSASAAELARSILAQGWQVQALPMLEIEPIANPGLAAALRHQFARSDARSLAIFISVNAVQCTAALMQQGELRWPDWLHCVGIGDATLAAIALQGWPVRDLHAGASQPVQALQPHNSEALLGALQGMDLNGALVLQFCGQGGRQFLAEQLVAMGAVVNRVETYRRRRPALAAKEFSTSISGFLSAPEATKVMQFASAETLANFCDYARSSGYWDQLRATTAVVPGRRVADEAARMGLQCVIVADNASAQAFLRVLATLQAG